MLRLDKSKNNTIALHLNTTESLSSELFLDYSQDYDLSSGSIPFTITETKGKYRIGTIASVYVPSYSGLYTIEVYEAGGVSYPWDSTAVQWNAMAVRWNEAGSGKIGAPIRNIRASVSGSNNPSFTEYSSPNELGKYSTYNG